MPRKERKKCGKCCSQFDGVARSHDAPSFSIKLESYEACQNTTFEKPCVFCGKCYSHIINYYKRKLFERPAEGKDGGTGGPAPTTEALAPTTEALAPTTEALAPTTEAAVPNTEAPVTTAEDAIFSTNEANQDNSESVKVSSESYTPTNLQCEPTPINQLHNEYNEEIGTPLHLCSSPDIMDIGETSNKVTEADYSTLKSEMFDSNQSCSNSEEIPLQHVETAYSQSSSTFNIKKHSLRSRINRRVQKSRIHIPTIASVPTTQCRCFICSQESRTRVPKSAADNMWITKRIYIPTGSRACKRHVQNGIFCKQTKEAIQQKMKPGAWLTVAEMGHVMHRLGEAANKNIIDVENSSMTDADFKLLFGVSKQDFDRIFESIQGKMRDSSNRSSRNALAVLLAKLRLGISQRLLAYLFGIPNQRQVSSIISRVTELLDCHFVPQQLGYHVMDREQLLNETNVELVSKLFEVEPKSACIFLDGTYIFIQKSKDHRFQRKTYSLHKFRNLLKVMMVVLPNGKVLFADGMYYADYGNSDSYILEHMLQKELGISSFIRPGDHMVVDRGFQNITRKLTRTYKIKTHMPALLKKKQSQFTTKEANETRKITMVRWIVESANGRIKNVFKFFDQVIPAHYFIKGSEKKLGAFFRISCAILNAYYPPLFTDSEKHQRILEAVKIRASQNNSLMKDIKIKNLYREKANWVLADATSVPDFPILSEEDLFEITLGCYQTNNAFGYTKEHFSNNGNYKLFIHSSSESILRVKVQSRYHKNQSHDVWIEYKTSSVSSKAITRYYCTCKVGARTLGCCSHIAAPIWYLGYKRHTVVIFQPSQFGLDILDAMEQRVNVEPDLESESDSDASEMDEDSAETEIEEMPSDDEFYREHFQTLDLIHSAEENYLEDSQSPEIPNEDHVCMNTEIGTTVVPDSVE